MRPFGAERTGRSLVHGAALAAAVLVAACVAPTGASDRAAERPSATPVATSPERTGDVVYLRQLDRRGGIIALDADTGAQLGVLPWGVATPNWDLLYRVETDGADTAIRALDVRTGATTMRRALNTPYRYALPTLSFVGEPGGLSPNARWLALTRDGLTRYGADAGSSAFAVLDAGLRQPARFVELPGSFGFDAISDSGRYLYLEEYVGPAPVDGYRVRAYDLEAGALLPGALVDKTATGDRMIGTRVATIASRSGAWEYTLYARQGGRPFIHAIDLEERWSICLFLPVETSGEEDLAWAFVPSPDGTRGYVVNGVKGYLASIDLNTATVLRTGSFAATRSETSPLEALARLVVPVADAKSELFAAAAVSPDGKTLYASGDFGSRVYAFETSSLALVRQFAVAGGVSGLGVSPNGASLYASTGDALVRLDPATGAVRSRVPLGAVGLARVLRVSVR